MEIFRETAAAMAEGGVDGFAIETMMDLQEARAALLGVREAAPDLPVLVTMTFEPSGRTLTGVHPVCALNALQALGADAFGCNCSTGPAEMAEILAEIKPFAKIPLIAKPNAGLPRMEQGRTIFPMGPEEFASYADRLFESGASIFGGCCGTTPEHIRCLSNAVKKCGKPEKRKPGSGVVSSVSEYRRLSVDQLFTVIGERINPTGKKALQAELRAGKTDLIFDFALQQTSAGASILDVNMGLSGIQESEMMRKALCRLLHCTAAPLCIDSTDPDTVEQALRLYPGRALLNSISAEEKRLKQILPIAAKYGAMLILLPLTDDGIPATAEERMKVVDLILKEAAQYGYTVEDVCVDALIMTVSANPEAAKVSLELIRRCTERGMNTVCGLSNVSFGLPSRPLLNQTFLGMAMGHGLNMAIANPLSEELMNMIAAGDVLSGRDRQMKNFLSKFANSAQTGKPEQGHGRSSSAMRNLTPDEQVFQCVLLGDAEGIVKRIDALLAAGRDPSDIISDILIPAITEVGKKYESKEYFLPQLIMSAEAMEKASKYLEPLLLKEKGPGGQKTKMILATVKGDIHDIGKNIVGVMFRNYDFDVIDLGKDVPPERILDTAVRENVTLIGLSALMTTTMNSMRDVINLAKARGLTHLKFMIGGAVVDQNFADEIGAYYAPDPMSAVRLAKKLLNLE